MSKEYGDDDRLEALKNEGWSTLLGFISLHIFGFLILIIWVGIQLIFGICLGGC